MRRLGTVPDMLPVYHAADLAVMPSLYEGLPNAVLEALACGLPAVVSHAANVDGLVIEGQAGYEVPALAPRALASALGRLIAASDEQRRAMGAAGRSHIVERFSAARVLGEIVDLYDSLLDAKGLATSAASRHVTVGA